MVHSIIYGKQKLYQLTSQAASSHLEMEVIIMGRVGLLPLEERHPISIACSPFRSDDEQRIDRACLFVSSFGMRLLPTLIFECKRYFPPGSHDDYIERSYDA